MKKIFAFAAVIAAASLALGGCAANDGGYHPGYNEYFEFTSDAEVRYDGGSVSLAVNADTPSSDDLSFISCVAEFGLILRNSAYKGTASLASVLTRLDGLSGYIANDGFKQEFVTLVGKASETKYLSVK